MNLAQAIKDAGDLKKEVYGQMSCCGGGTEEELHKHWARLYDKGKRLEIYLRNLQATLNGKQ